MNPRPLATLAVIALLSVAKVHAQPGTLDPSFGNGGLVTTDFFHAADVIEGLALAPDGTIVAVGFAYRPGHSDLAVARYSADGQLIATATFDFRPDELINEEARRVAVLPDGRLVVAGMIATSHTAASYDLLLIRLLPTLSLDATFGNNGVVMTTAFSGYPDVRGLAVQKDGRIVLGGAFGLMRFDDDGSIDAAFGAQGRVAPLFSPSESLLGMALQPDGRIVVVGVTFDMGAQELSLARFLTDGSLDTTFGTGGKVFLSAYVADGFSVVVQPDGRIVVAGAVLGVTTTSDVALWRFDGHGQLDASFGVGGRVFTDVGGHDVAVDVGLQADGRIVAAGLTQQPPDGRTTDFVVARYEANGDLDATFGTGGLTTTDFFGDVDWAMGMVIEPGGGIVVGGYVGNPVNGTTDFGLAGYQRQPLNQPPVISAATASPAVLWPSNHKLVDIAITYDVTDDFDPAPTCAVAVTSNEPAETRGDGRTWLDWQVINAHHVRLRAERSGTGAGRTYTVTITCRDLAGLESQRQVRVTVPKSR